MSPLFGRAIKINNLKLPRPPKPMAISHRLATTRQVRGGSVPIFKRLHVLAGQRDAECVGCYAHSD
jgi:hypothetical protein